MPKRRAASCFVTRTRPRPGRAKHLLGCSDEHAVTGREGYSNPLHRIGAGEINVELWLQADSVDKLQYNQSERGNEVM